MAPYLPMDKQEQGKLIQPNSIITHFTLREITPRTFDHIFQRIENDKQ